MFQIAIALGVAALYRLSRMSPGVLNSYSRRHRYRSDTRIVSVRGRTTFSVLAAASSLLIQAVNAGLITSPTGGGPGNVSGTLYFTSWMGLLLAFELCLRYLELYSTGGGRASAKSSGGRSTRSNEPSIVENVTVYEDDEDESEESMLMLRNGSDDGGSKRRNSSRAIIVEDASLDAESYVFGDVVPRQQQQQEPASRVQQQEPPRVQQQEPSVAHNTAQNNRRSGVDPEESSGIYIRSLLPPLDSRSQSAGSDPSGTQDVGSIDVRSAQRSSNSSTNKRSSNSSTKRTSSGEDPDATDERKEQYRSKLFQSVRYSGSNRYSDFDDDIFSSESEHDLRNSAFFSGGPSFHADEVEELDDTRHTQEKEQQESAFQQQAAPAVPRQDSSTSFERTTSSQKLSPLVEGGSSEEKSPPTGESSGADNQARKAAQQRQGPPLTKAKAQGGGASKKSASTSRSSRSRSRDKGMNASPYSGKAGGAHMSRQSSRKSTRSRSRGGGTGDKSRVSRSSTLSSGLRGGGPVSAGILTDDEDGESGSNPPPTMSESGMSAKDDLSGYPSTKSSSPEEGSGSPYRRSRSDGHGVGPPPPPPFSRSKSDKQRLQQQQNEYDAASQYSSSAPVRSIHTNTGPGHNDSDSVVSEPTLDAGLIDPPKPSSRPMQHQPGGKRASSRSKSRSKSPHHHLRSSSSPSSGGDPHNLHNSSSETGSYNKKYSDETEPANSSDGNPSSHEGSTQVVDNIVAAALAYAEHTHGQSNDHGLIRGSGVTSGSTNIRESGTTISSNQRPAGSSNVMESFNTSVHSASLHSFYTDSDKGSKNEDGGGGGKKKKGKGKENNLGESHSTDYNPNLRESHSTANPRYLSASTTAPVDDLVARALMEAQGQLDSKKTSPPGSGGAGSAGQELPKPARQKLSRAFEMQRSGGASTKSGKSMYSEGTEDSGQDFDC